ncbi:integrase [Gossypium australe]|uniref:Integrase n=1 Tax=Gossypium australe TaxID=47621 RepID=A0A5B6X2M3_9ROSI|nr:integrase [Gossypium australe]
MLIDDGSIIVELKAKPAFLQICVMRNSDIIQNILQEAQNSNYLINPGSNKMYVKAKNQVSSKLLQPVMILEWKWEWVTMDFVSRLPLPPRKKDAI